MEPSEREAEDAFARGFHGVPDDAELKTMSVVQLSSLLSSSEKGSAKWLVIKEEIYSRREAETLSIAKEANRLASEANEIARSQLAAAWRASRYAMYAAAVAATAAVAANREAILALISG